MGIINWELNQIKNPKNVDEINYNKYAKELKGQDLEMYNNNTKQILVEVEKKLKEFYSFFAFVVIMFIIVSFLSSSYSNPLMLIIGIMLFILGIVFYRNLYSYTWIGIYERSWIKLLEHKQLIPKITRFQKIGGKTTSIVLPSVLSYLDENDTPENN